jgi:hypothetical protein
VTPSELPGRAIKDLFAKNKHRKSAMTAVTVFDGWLEADGGNRRRGRAMMLSEFSD